MVDTENQSNIKENYCMIHINLVNLFRCEDAEAYEVQDGGKSTGIFTKYLNKHILQEAEVTHVLERVSEGECFKSTTEIPLASVQFLFFETF